MLVKNLTFCKAYGDYIVTVQYYGPTVEKYPKKDDHWPA